MASSRCWSAGRFVAAPMVNHSSRAFRLLVRRNGADLAFTQMINARCFAPPQAQKYRLQIFDGFEVLEEDRPLVAQIAGSDRSDMVETARLLEDYAEAIDINFGCPQKIAKKGRYGAYLLEEQELVCQLVKEMTSAVETPITCKIRLLLSGIGDSIELAHRLQDAGCSMLTVHGRTRLENKQLSGSADWDAIARIKEALEIPVIANGNIETFADIERCLQWTKADGVMSSEALLENPALFSGRCVCHTKLSLDFIDICREYPPRLGSTKSHLFKMMHMPLCKLGRESELRQRERIGRAQSLDDLEAIVRQVSNLLSSLEHELVEGLGRSEVLSWYRRHWPDKTGVSAGQQAHEVYHGAFQ